MLAVLLGPSVAEKGEGNGAGGYAEKFGMVSITVPAIAFMAVLVSSTAGTRITDQFLRIGSPCTHNGQQVRVGYR